MPEQPVNDHAESILIDALDKRWQRYRRERKKTESKFSETNVHNLRVASRRLIAVIDTVRSIFSSDKDVQQCRRRLKKFLDVLSPLRDVHVQRMHIAKLLRRFPQLKDFQKSIVRDEDKLTRKVEDALKKSPKLRGPISKTRHRIEELSPNGARPQETRRVITAVADERYRELIDLARQIDRSDSETIHRTRLAFKKFRYTVEVVHPLVEGVTKTRLKQLHTFQTKMGDIQDVEVMSAKLKKWAQRKNAGTREVLTPVFQELENQRATYITRFMKSSHKLNEFWKPQ